MSPMSKLRQIESAVQRLFSADLARFREWFAEFDAARWDEKLEADVKAGKLDALADRALRDHADGRSTEL